MSGAHGVGLQLAALSRGCRRMTEWLRIHKPHAVELGIFAHDYELVAKHPQYARKYGFVFDDARICIDGYLLFVAGGTMPRITPTNAHIYNANDLSAANDPTPGAK